MEPFQGKGRIGICKFIKEFDSLAYLSNFGLAIFILIVILTRIHIWINLTIMNFK